MENKLVNDMTEGNVARQLFGFAGPFILSSILQAVYNLVDMAVVGQFVGNTGSSAVGIGGQVLILLTAIGIGFSSGGQIMISQLVGAKDYKRINSTIGTLFSALGILSVVLMICGIIFCGNILSLLNAPSESFSQASDYLTICSCGMVFIYGYNGVCGVLRGMGESKLPFVFVLIATVVNIVLDLLFVAGFGMAAAGAALATILGQAVAFIISIIYLYRRRDVFGFDFKRKSFKIIPKTLKALIKIGLPLSLQTALINISMLFVNSHVNTYGVVASAVDSIGCKINSIMGVVSSSMNAAGAAMVGQNLGAGKTDRIKKIYWTINIVCIGFWICLSGLFYLFPQQIFGIFTSDPNALALAPTYLHIAIVFYATFVTMSAQLAVINGVGNAPLNMCLAILDGVVVRISLAFFLESKMGLSGLWLGNAAAGFTTTIIGGIYYFSGRWKERTILLK